MTLRTALTDYRRERDDEAFPGERRTTTGLFSSSGTRLVHVAADGSLRDYSEPLCGLTGLDRSRFGVETTEGLRWFDEADAEQRYLGESATVETVHDFGDWRISQYDRTDGDGHVTRFELGGESPQNVRLGGFAQFAPDGREGQLGNLVHEGVFTSADDSHSIDAVEAYHRREHDFLGVSTGFESLQSLPQAGFEDLCSDAALDEERDVPPGRYEEANLTGAFRFTASFEGESVTVATLLTDRTETTREVSFDRLRSVAGGGVGVAADTDEMSSPWSWKVPQDVPYRDVLVDDLRAVSLLTADSGARIAGPEFDPFTQYTGGYGYAWFRDDAEIARALLVGGQTLGVPLGDSHDRSAAFYRRTQLDDGSWPHRVWPDDGALAPGWANARLAGGGADYQADQTASVVAFLATYLRVGEPSDSEAVAETMAAGLAALDDTLADDGLPTTCQNAWENMTGRFAHTAATYLHAYAAVARAPVEEGQRDRARRGADAVVDGLDRLWAGDRYALREDDGALDDRFDASTFALVDAVAEYAALAGLDDGLRDRLVAHTETTLDGLWTDRDAVRGLVRFEGDDWRTAEQRGEKVWTVSTVWGAAAAAELGVLLETVDDERAAGMFDRARSLLAELLPGGSLVAPSGYLPEQYFDDGTPDSATPLAWPHALRFATIARLASVGELPPDA